jgi:hypothetical protein
LDRSARWARKASISTPGRGMRRRLLAVFGSWKCSSPKAAWSVWFTVAVPASRSMSLQRTLSSSPRLMPVPRASSSAMYKLVLLAARGMAGVLCVPGAQVLAARNVRGLNLRAGFKLVQPVAGLLDHGDVSSKTGQMAPCIQSAGPIRASRRARGCRSRIAVL